MEKRKKVKRKKRFVFYNSGLLILFLLLLDILIMIPIKLYVNSHPKNPNAAAWKKISAYSDTDTWIDWNDWAFINIGQALTSEPPVKIDKFYLRKGDCPYDVKGVTTLEDGVNINVISAWEITRGSEDVIVGVIDNGIYSRNLSGYVMNTSDWLTPDRSDYVRSIEHGTWITTTIHRVAPGVKILVASSLCGKPEEITKKIAMDTQELIDSGASIINFAWVLSEDFPEIRAVIKDNPDVLFVCSTGMCNSSMDERLYPVSYPYDNIIRVMGFDKNGKPIFEGFGSGCALPDIAAPGKNVRVIGRIRDLKRKVEGKEDEWEDYFELDTQFTDNSSHIATAFISGTAALIKSLHPEMTAVDIRNTIINNAVQSDSFRGVCAAGGYLDVYACLKAK